MPCTHLQELYSGQYVVLAGIATGFTVGPHVIMSLLLIVRQGWLLAASQAVGFILTLNPFENLTPIPQGIVGLFVLSIGFIAYVLIAASGGLTGTCSCCVVAGVMQGECRRQQAAKELRFSWFWFEQGSSAAACGVVVCIASPGVT